EIVVLDDRLGQAEGDITDLDGRVTTNTANIAQNAEDITDLGGRVTTNEGNITANTAAIAENAAFCGRGDAQDSINCGTGSVVEADAADGIAIGSNALVQSAGGIALGRNATAVESNSVAIGSGAVAQSSVAVGTGAQATGTNSTAVGDGAVASGATAVAVGNKAQAAAENSVALGNGSIADQANTVSVGTPGAQRRITNLAPGVDPTDAVNVSQLNQFSAAVNHKFNQQGRRISAVGALSAALNMATPDPRVRGNTQVALGIGYYRGAEAIGASIGRLFGDGNAAVRIGGSFAEHGETMVGAGMTFGF
ncbi:MAG: YadA-like family protein, partial [Salinisphaera sp.]|nr:YadA-like family protein [Salinisphaera sp.]